MPSAKLCASWNEPVTSSAAGSVTSVEKEYDMVVQYDDRYEIDLGSSDRLAYKVQYLQAILEQLSDFQAGTIDLTLSEANRAKFHPKA